MFFQIKEVKNEFIIFAKSCTSGGIEYVKNKLIFLAFLYSLEKYNLLNNKTVVNNHSLLHFNERYIYFK